MVIKLLAGVLACGLLAGCGARAAGVTAARVTVPASRYVVCQSLAGACAGATPKHEPSVLYLSADGSGWAKDITWNGWGTVRATGHGVAEIDNCQPNCASGTYTEHLVTITLTAPKRWHKDLAYTRAVVSIPSVHEHETLGTGLLPRPAPSLPPPASTSPATGPVSNQATVTGSCVTGMYDTGTGEFYSMSDLQKGSTTPSGDDIAEAYQLTLTDTSPSATAAVTGFAVVFYSNGQELTSDQQALSSTTFITPGQSLTWTEYPWGTSVSGQGASVGPFAAGGMGAVNVAATCQLIQWSHP